MMEWLLFAAALFVALSNGANDNFKGFATVWGSGTLTYAQALRLATAATLAGSLASWLLAQTLVLQFTGKGLVPDAVATSLPFITSVALATAVTVFLATRFGFPISTTHALIGGLVGAGLAQHGGTVHFAKLADSFLLPLLVSPLAAALLSVFVHRWLRLRPVENDCACITAPESAVVAAIDGSTSAHMSAPALVIAREQDCAGLAAPVRLSISRSLARLHVLSAMAICFARGVNDTPKLVALLIAAQVLRPAWSVVPVSLVMALGGVLFARRVAQTMSQRLTRMDHASGLAANLITATLVLAASKFGLPVSTTHVAVGSIAGVGASTKTLDKHALRQVLLSWIVTLPLAAGVAWMLVPVL